MRKITLFIYLFMFLTAFPLIAQDTAADSLLTPQRVEVTTADNITLVGDFYAVPDAASAMPSVILLHGQGSDRHEWTPLIAPLLDGSFNVLNVDQRSFGESGGNREMLKMIDDIQVWIDWLQTQPTVRDNAISTIGSSMGTVPALGGCAADPDCMTAIAISPGDFPTLDGTTFAKMSERSVLFVVGRKDNVLYDTKKLFARTSGESAMMVYNTATHGRSFFTSRNSFYPRITRLIINWLNDHLPPALYGLTL
ncbi:MAG: alpha/beta hydrolase [Chloroflexota bacterium]